MILKRFVDGVACGSGARTACVLLGLLALCCVVGCGEGTPASLSGKVTFNGEPIENGTIQLRPTGETPGSGGAAKITGGSYQIATAEGLVAGTYSVMINALRAATPEEAAKMAAEDEMEGEAADFESEEGEAAAPAEVEPTVQFIPGKYNVNTELTAELSGGENTKDFDLTP